MVQMFVAFSEYLNFIACSLSTLYNVNVSENVKDQLTLKKNQKYVCWCFLVQVKTLRFAFEINWPLLKSNSGLTISEPLISSIFVTISRLLCRSLASYLKKIHGPNKSSVSVTDMTLTYKHLLPFSYAVFMFIPDRVGIITTL